MAQTQDRIRDLTETRAGLLQILSEHGALNEMVKLQERHSARCADLERVKTQIERRRQMESDKRQLYDGVDSRQRAAALERAHAVADDTGTQYICALNSDMVPYDEFREGFAFNEHVRCRLTDGEPAGTLLGIVFDPPARS